jgi:hypothetical protein
MEQISWSCQKAPICRSAVSFASLTRIAFLTWSTDGIELW